MVVLLKYKCAFKFAADRMFAHIWTEFKNEHIGGKMNRDDKQKLKIRLKALKDGKVSFFWDDDNDKIFWMKINDPLLEDDAIKEWAGEGMRKRLALKFGRRYLQAHGIKIEIFDRRDKSNEGIKDDSKKENEKEIKEDSDTETSSNLSE